MLPLVGFGSFALCFGRCFFDGLLVYPFFEKNNNKSLCTVL